MLAPLTEIPPKKVKLKCAKIEQDAFDEIKRIVARDNLLNYPGFNEQLKIHNDARNFQLRAVIIRKSTQK